MPRKTQVPSYRLHKASGQARTIVNGRHVYLGKYGSPESRKEYARVLAEHSASPVVPTGLPEHSAAARKCFLVSEVIVSYLKFAEGYYSKAGTPTKEFQNMLDAVALLNDLYGDTMADEFGPLKLKAVGECLIESKHCRTEINKRTGRISHQCVVRFNSHGFPDPQQTGQH